MRDSCSDSSSKISSHLTPDAPHLPVLRLAFPAAHACLAQLPPDYGNARNRQGRAADDSGYALPHG